MKPDEIQFWDLQRIFIGEIPAIFFIELIFRCLFIYFLLIFSMRMMGKRMSTQIGRNEMAAVVSLAAAVGIPLMNPDRGLLPGAIIAVVIIIMQRFISKLTINNETLESVTQDDLSILVKDSVMDLSKMKKNRISRARLVAQLRSLGIRNLGMVDRLYLESNGMFSLVKREEEQPGLSLIPAFDTAFQAQMRVDKNRCACYACGRLHDSAYFNTPLRCENCGASHWAEVVYSKP